MCTILGKDACVTHDLLKAASHLADGGFPQTEFKVVLFTNKDAYLIKVTEVKKKTHNLLHIFVRVIPVISTLNKMDHVLQLCRVSASSVVVEFKVEGSGAKRIEALEALVASVEVMMMLSLLALWIHGILPLVELCSQLYGKKNSSVRNNG